VATRYSSFEPRGKGSPNGTDAFERGHEAHPSAGGALTPPLVAIEEQPLSPEDCAIGEVVAGKYLVEGVIGRGSMGVVVRATHLGFDELVALKFIRPEMRKIDGIVSRFAREAKASVRIRNEHAVNVLDVGVADPIGPFFVMEYLEGINLEELVDTQGPFDAAAACKYVLEACEALAAAHAQGIIHRDIKPQNIFLAWQGRLELIKILDFGISKAALSGQVFGDDLSSGDQDWVMGTPLYMSPEQLRHAPDVDERTDIWSLGAVLYELLVGRPLFSGDTPSAVCQQVFDAGQRPIRVDLAHVPDGLWDVIERCLGQRKEDRYANVADLGLALMPFAPAAACLHIERARALLGLERLDFTFEEPIEEIEAEPIDEPEPAAALAAAKPSEAQPPQTARPAGSLAANQLRRPPQWVEIALPLLTCAVLWIGYRQWQHSRDPVARDELARRNAMPSDEAVQTVALALRQSGLQPVSAADAQQRADCPVPGNTGAGAQPGGASQAPGSAARAPGLASNSSVASGDDGTRGSPPPLAAQHASGVRRAPAPAAGMPPSPPVPAGSALAPSSAAASANAPAQSAATEPPLSDAAADAARRPPKAKPKLDPKPQFRLIDDLPPPAIELVPGGGSPSRAPQSSARPAAALPSPALRSSVALRSVVPSPMLPSPVPPSPALAHSALFSTTAPTP
jgi:serine/threonine protein kinase